MPYNDEDLSLLMNDKDEECFFKESFFKIQKYFVRNDHLSIGSHAHNSWSNQFLE